MNKEAYADGLQTRPLQQLFSILIDSGKSFKIYFPSVSKSSSPDCCFHLNAGDIFSKAASAALTAPLAHNQLTKLARLLLYIKGHVRRISQAGRYRNTPITESTSKMDLTSHLMTPSESTTKHTTLGNPPYPPYPPYPQTRTLNNYDFELPVSLENLFSNDASTFSVAHRPTHGAFESSSTSPTSAEHSHINYDYCDQTVPGSYYQPNYITMKPDPPINFDALAPSFFYPAMIPSDGFLPHGHARGSADNGYSLLSYGNNASSNPLQEDTLSNYARRNTEPNMGMLSLKPTSEWGYRQSVMSTRSNHASSPNYEASSDNVFACPVCDKSFAKRHSLKLHMRSHSTEKPFKCSLCEKTFARCHDMKRHQQLHKGVKVFRCEGHLRDGVTKWGCGKKFARSDALTRHLRAGAGRRCLKPLVDESRAFDVHPLVQATALNNSDLADAPGRPILSISHA